MTGRPLLLQSFDALADPIEHAARDVAAGGGPGAAPGAGPGADAASGPAAADAADMAAPEPDIPPEPSAEERLAERIDRLLAALSELADSGLATLDADRREAVEAFARACADALPSLAETGFAAEVAAATMEIARMSRPRAVVLHAAPEDLAAIRDALDHRERAELPTNLPLRLVEDPRVAPGEVALRWDGGGAEIEADTLARTALESLDRALETLVPAPRQARAAERCRVALPGGTPETGAGQTPEPVASGSS